MMQKRKLPQMIKEITAAILKKPFTLQYPFTRPHPPQSFRGRQVFHPDRCISCGLCARDCPAQAIDMVDVSGRKMPMIHLDSCIFCYICVEHCPRNALTESTFYELASTSKDDLVLKPEEPSQDKRTEAEG